MSTNVLMHPKDSQPEKERDIGRNLTLKSIVGHQVSSYNELANIDANTNAGLDATLDIIARLNRVCNNIKEAVRLMTELEANIYIAKKRTSELNQKMIAAATEYDRT